MYILPDDGLGTVKTTWRSGGEPTACSTRVQELRWAALITSTKPQGFIISNNYKGFCVIINKIIIFQM